MAGEDVSEFGEDIQLSLEIEYTPNTIYAGDEVDFDASESHGSTLKISEYLWEFGNGGSAIGKQVTHEFTEAGEYEVSLRVIYEDGSEEETEQKVTVKEMDE